MDETHESNEKNEKLIAYIPELLSTLEKADQVIEQMMPGVPYIAMDIGLLNDTLIEIKQLLIKVKDQLE